MSASSPTDLVGSLRRIISEERQAERHEAEVLIGHTSIRLLQLAGLVRSGFQWLPAAPSIGRFMLMRSVSGALGGQEAGCRQPDDGPGWPNLHRIRDAQRRHSCNTDLCRRHRPGQVGQHGRIGIRHHRPHPQEGRQGEFFPDPFHEAIAPMGSPAFGCWIDSWFMDRAFRWSSSRPMNGIPVGRPSIQSSSLYQSMQNSTVTLRLSDLLLFSDI